ncbi:putative transporter YcgH [Pontibacillus salipaludis]|uniref:Transporter YcgH n=2 Tax=Pontibacillus salipaludis TaxID=1697394 RepID=A0ABQ1PY40_9BACI|nr:putative transporter YcgH [Pontibacillus salipaludis]
MSKEAKEGHLTWWQMSLIGVGCIIGTGYFLGASISIQKAGWSVLLAYLLAGMATYIVFQSLAKLTAHHPEKGSFRTYAKQAYGNWAGFSNGWVYWSSEMLIMGSQLTALGIFAQFWFPSIPLWVFSAVFSGLGLFVILLGVEKVEKMENIFGVMKVAAILMFVIIAGAALFGLIEMGKPMDRSGKTSLFANGAIGLWGALVYAFYAFGGIEVMGLMAKEMKDPGDAPKSGKIMLAALTGLYVLSIFLVVKLTPLSSVNADESPFLTSLARYDLPFVSHAFNGVLIIAGFSTMVASLYAVTTMLVTLAEEGDAPKLFAKEGKWNVPLPAFTLITLVVIVSIIIALLLPGKLFEYVTTAAGLMLLYTWIFILFSYRKLMAKGLKDTILFIFSYVLIVGAITGTLWDPISRKGFFVSLLFLFLIASATWLKERRRG